MTLTTISYSDVSNWYMYTDELPNEYGLRFALEFELSSAASLPPSSVPLPPTPVSIETVVSHLLQQRVHNVSTKIE